MIPDPEGEVRLLETKAWCTQSRRWHIVQTRLKVEEALRRDQSRIALESPVCMPLSKCMG